MVGVRSRLPWLALGVVYLFWSTPYLANRLIISTVPPLLAGGDRFLVGGAALAVVVLAVAGRSAFRMTPAQLGTTALSGLLLPAWGNGLVALAQQVVSSGLAALLIAAVPLWIVLLRVATGDRPRPATLVGTGIGVVGLAVLVLAGPASGGVDGTAWWGPWVVLLSSLGWAVGSFATTRLPVPANPFALASVQMLTGGVIMLGAGTAVGERIDWAAITPTSWWAWAYMTVIVSVVAFSAFSYSLGSLPISTVTTYAYINPVLAVLLGVLVVGERFTAVQLVGGAIVLAAVVVVISAERNRRGVVAPSRA